MTSRTDNHAPQTPADAAAAVDDLLVQAVDEYLERLESGQQLDLESFVARYPEIAQELRECLEALEFVDGVAPLMQQQESDNPPRDQLKPLAALGDFRIIREIGRGGMGIVYEAEQLSIGRKVALKVLPFAAVLDPKTLQRFKQEAQAAGALKHPHIVGVHSVGCERGVHYYAMELVEGRSLAQVIAGRNEPTQAAGNNQDVAHPDSETAPVAALSTKSVKQKPQFFRAAAQLGVQCAEALEHAHACGIVHRDVKPSNLLIDATGHLWVTDFGLAQLEGDATRLTMTGDLLGTLRYMSPEQAVGDRRVLDHRTDVYSLGITLYELLTGRVAFEGSDRGRLLRQIIEEDPRSLREIDASIPRDLETIVLKAISKEPSARYATAGELAADLQRFLDDKPVVARRPGPLNRVLRWCNRNRLVTGLSLGLVCTVFATVFALARQANQRPAPALPPSTALSLRTVLEGGDEVFGAISPDGRRLVYPNYSTANLALFDLETSGRHDVTTEGMWDAVPAEQQYGEAAIWSHDGRSLAYNWFIGSTSAGGETAQLRLLSADGNDSRVIYEHRDGRAITPLSWSGDGRKILVALWNRKDRLSYALVAIEDGSVDELVAFEPPLPEFCQLSPDGRYAVLARAPAIEATQHDLLIVETETRQVSPLVEHPADDRTPFWTPDGRWIVFLSDRGGRTALWAVRCIDGRPLGTPRLVHEQMDGVTPQGFDKQGSFYYSALSSRSDIYTATVDFENVAVTGPPQKIESRYEGRNTVADWSPTGDRLAYLSRVGPDPSRLRLTVRQLESGRETELQPGDPLRRVMQRADLQWLPTGDSLMMQGFDMEDHLQWMLIDAQSGKVTRALGEETRRAAVAWKVGADGRSLYFCSPWRVFHLDLLTEELKAIYQQTDLENGIRNLAVSSDGSRLAVATGLDLRIFPAEGGEPRILPAIDPQSDNTIAYALAWTPDAQRLLFGITSKSAQDNIVSLWQIQVDDGEAQALGIVMPGLQYLRIHPDGRQILFKARSPGQEGQLWAIDNVLAHLNSKE